MLHSLNSLGCCGVHLAPLHKARQCHVTSCLLGFDMYLAFIVLCILLCEAEAGGLLAFPYR